MGISSSWYCLHSVRRFPVKLFDRLGKRDPTASVPEFAGRRIRYMMALVDTEQRRTSRVKLLQCHFLKFDESGRLDEDAEMEEMRAAMQTLDSSYLDSIRSSKPTSVRHAAHLFARRAYKHRYQWKPTPEILRQIGELLFPQSRTH
jgi:hypothetical protein